VLQITPQMRILVAIEAVDGRKGIDSLCNCVERGWQRIHFQAVCFSFEVAVRLRFVCLPTMAKDFGLHRSACPRDVSSGGQQARNPHEPCERIKRSC
jgi:hypothetical protein